MILVEILPVLRLYPLLFHHLLTGSVHVNPSSHDAVYNLEPACKLVHTCGSDISAQIMVRGSTCGNVRKLISSPTLLSVTCKHVDDRSTICHGITFWLCWLPWHGEVEGQGRSGHGGLCWHWVYYCKAVDRVGNERSGLCQEYWHN